MSVFCLQVEDFMQSDAQNFTFFFFFLSITKFIYSSVDFLWSYSLVSLNCLLGIFILVVFLESHSISSVDVGFSM
jgi:hypothetical protein